MTIPNASPEQQTIIDHIKEGKNVAVNACAGSGKSTTILSCANQLAHKKMMQITYNSLLREEINHSIRDNQIQNLEVHTFHSLAVKYYSHDAYTDDGMRRILNNNKPSIYKIRPIDIFVLDETQDMSELYFQFVLYFLRDMNVHIQIMVLGDFRQGIYEFKGADTRFLTKAPEIWRAFSLLKTDHFECCELKTSYRITHQMANFINDILLKEPGKLVACKDGETVVYIRRRTEYIKEWVVKECKGLVAMGVPLSSISILSDSVSGENIYNIENALVQNNIPCFVQNNLNEKLDPRVIEGKIVFSTFHSAKGRERQYIFVHNFNHKYFQFKPDLDPEKCPNTIYVSTTRAIKRLYLLDKYDDNDDRPFKFFTHREVMENPCVTFIGVQPDVYGDAPPPHHQQPANGEPVEKKNKTTPTKLIKFTKETTMNRISAILERIFVVEQPPATELEIPNIVKTRLGYEDVSDLNGIAIPNLYFSELTRQNVVLQMIIERIEDKRELNRYPFLKHKISEIREKYSEKNDQSHCMTPNEQLYLTNILNAIQERTLFRVNQIHPEEYNWLTPEIIQQTNARISKQFPPNTHVEVEQTILYDNDELHAKIDEWMSARLPEVNKIRFSAARVDVITPDTIWELKCTNDISVEFLMQVVIYAWIWKMVYPHKPKIFRIFNIKTNEIRRLETRTPADLDDIMYEIIRGKYLKDAPISDEMFVQQCNQMVVNPTTNTTV
jgi:hypothetical protein